MKTTNTAMRISNDCLFIMTIDQKWVATDVVPFEDTFGSFERHFDLDDPEKFWDEYETISIEEQLETNDRLFKAEDGIYHFDEKAAAFRKVSGFEAGMVYQIIGSNAYRVSPKPTMSGSIATYRWILFFLNPVTQEFEEFKYHCTYYNDVVAVEDRKDDITSIYRPHPQTGHLELDVTLVGSDCTTAGIGKQNSDGQKVYLEYGSQDAPLRRSSVYILNQDNTSLAWEIKDYQKVADLPTAF